MNSHLLGGLEEQPRLRLTASAVFVGAMGAVEDPVYPPANGFYRPDHPAMNVLQNLYRYHAPVDNGLVGNHDDQEVRTAQPDQGIQHTRQEDEFLPRFHVVLTVATNHAIPVNKYCSLHRGHLRSGLHGIGAWSDGFPRCRVVKAQRERRFNPLEPLTKGGGHQVTEDQMDILNLLHTVAWDRDRDIHHTT